MSENYGDKFETPIIIAMCTLIVLSFVGVIAMQKKAHKDCTNAEYTYCGPEKAHH